MRAMADLAKTDQQNLMWRRAIHAAYNTPGETGAKAWLA